MKKMLLATALALCTGCAQQTFTVQNKPAAVAPKKPSPIIFVSRLGRENCRCSQNLWRRRNVVKTETQQTFVNGFAQFYYFRHLSPLGAATLLLTIVHELPIDMGNSSAAH